MNVLLLGFPVLKAAFLQCGHDVLTCTTDQSGDIWIDEFPVSMKKILQALPGDWNPDLVLLMDESTEPMYLGLERLDVPLAWYTIDAHLHLDWHKAYTSVFDFVFVAQRDYVPDYEHDSTRQVVRWLPLFCNPDRDRYSPLPKIYDLSFVGAINERWKPERSRLLNAVMEHIPMYTTTGEYVSVFNRSKVVFNECAANDINFRVFEALACGSLLLTEKIGNGFEELFQDRTHLVMYERDNIGQIVGLAQHYMRHEEEREEIAHAGREKVLTCHTTVHRAQTIVDIVQTEDAHELVKNRRFKLDDIYHQLDRVYEHAASVYEVASRRYRDSPPQFRECLRTSEMFRDVRLDVVRRLGDSVSCVETNLL